MVHEFLDILIFGGSLLHCGVLDGVPSARPHPHSEEGYL